MLNSDMKIDYISAYINSYEEKIKLKNKQGLFDTATMFELFAKEVCQLWFGNEFVNLNIKKFNFPYVDLVSDDGETYIQVSTRDDAKTKIKKTLENIRDTDNAELKKIKKVFFFMLHTEKIDKVEDFINENQIGDIPFEKEKNLITTQDIIFKARTNLDFLNELYLLISKDVNSYEKIIDTLISEINASKEIGLGNINDKLNDEYHIDRSPIIEEIIREDAKYISVQGAAGSGKSVICKELVSDNPNVLYARAERFIEETDINDIWHFDLQKAIEYINDNSLIIFIDSLEFIADIPNKLELLEKLYLLVGKNENIKIITSCRSGDRNAFLKLERKYNIKIYDVPDLTDNEISQISNQFDIINSLKMSNQYSALLRSPFYVNIIVSKIKNINDICDENSLRDYIWNNIICLKDNERLQKVGTHNEVVSIINDIVFERAKKFVLGVYEEKYNSKIIKLLISENILIRNNKMVRLKYDIFEDICFEQKFDALFDETKGKYTDFYEKIEEFGRCVNRRYQIWISNKLFSKKNRDKILYHLTFTDDIPLEWNRQTKIGIVKSKYCSEFFDEYTDVLIRDKHLKDFLSIINIYGFEIKNHFYSGDLSTIDLKCVGLGRNKMIEIVCKNKLFATEDAELDDLIIQLCKDYSKQDKINKVTSENACFILEYYLQVRMNVIDYNSAEAIKGILVSIYTFAKYLGEWIRNFFIQLKDFFISNNRDENHFAEIIIKDTLCHKHKALSKYLTNELCDLAEFFWTYKRPHLNGKYPLFYHKDNSVYDDFGLNYVAKQYDYDENNEYIYYNNFFWNLFDNKFFTGLEWSIKFVNSLVDNYKEKYKDNIYEIAIYFLDDKTGKTYYGNSDMWFFELSENRVPKLIGDLLYILKNRARVIINFLYEEKADYVKFMDKIKDIILQKSSNVFFLYILAQLAMECKDKYPGYGIDLITNMDLITWDLHRYAFLLPNPQREMLEKTICLVMGVPGIKRRYESNVDNNISLRDYMLETQLSSNVEIKNKCILILEYLYSKYPDSKESANENLQIQNMDIRKSEFTKVQEGVYALSSKIEGNALNIIEETQDKMKNENLWNNKVIDCIEKIPTYDYNFEECKDLVNQVIDNYKVINTYMFNNNYFITLLIYILADERLNCRERTKFCKFWIEGVQSIFSNNSFVFEYDKTIILFKHVELDITIEVKNKIKELMLEILISSSYNGIIYTIKQSLQQYLLQNQVLARTLFNTVLLLAKDRMEHHKYNVLKYNEINKRDKIVLKPNLQPYANADVLLQSNGVMLYKSKKEEIIQKYLLNAEEADFQKFNIKDYDINLVCLSLSACVNCNDEEITYIIHQLLDAIIILYDNEREDYDVKTSDILYTESKIELQNYIKFQLFVSENSMKSIIDCMFNHIDFDKANHEYIEFYLRIFDYILENFFYSFDKNNIRFYCQKIHSTLEEKINNIEIPYIKKQLSKSLILSDQCFMGHSGWEKVNVTYSYRDIKFLNDIFSKYGFLNLEDLLIIIYKLQYQKLLPEVLSSLRISIEKCKEYDEKTFVSIVKKRKDVLLLIINYAFINCSDDIKQDDALTNDFEFILDQLIKLGFAEAAVLLNEFINH